MKKINVKKVFVIMLITILSVAALSADKVKITWKWLPTNENIEYFRYQLDDTNPDNWTVVDSSITKVTIENLEGNKGHTLFLEESTDGKKWSDPEKYSVMPVTKKPKKIDKNSQFIIASMYGGLQAVNWAGPKIKGWRFEPSPNFFLYTGVDLGFHNLVKWGERSSLGVNVGLGYQAIPVGEKDKKVNLETYKKLWQNASGNAKYFFESLYNCTDLYFTASYDVDILEWLRMEFGLGAFLNMSWPARYKVNNKFISNSNMSISFGTIVSARTTFFITDLISMSVTPIYRYEIGNERGNSLSLQTSLGFRFYK